MKCLFNHCFLLFLTIGSFHQLVVLATKDLDDKVNEVRGIVFASSAGEYIGRDKVINYLKELDEINSNSIDSNDFSSTKDVKAEDVKLLLMINEFNSLHCKEETLDAIHGQYKLQRKRIQALSLKFKYLQANLLPYINEIEKESFEQCLEAMFNRFDRTIEPAFRNILNNFLKSIDEANHNPKWRSQEGLARIYFISAVFMKEIALNNNISKVAEAYERYFDDIICQRLCYRLDINLSYPVTLIQTYGTKKLFNKPNHQLLISATEICLQIADQCKVDEEPRQIISATYKYFYDLIKSDPRAKNISKEFKKFKPRFMELLPKAIIPTIPSILEDTNK